MNLNTIFQYLKEEEEEFSSIAFKRNPFKYFKEYNWEIPNKFRDEIIVTLAEYGMQNESACFNIIGKLIKKR